MPERTDEYCPVMDAGHCFCHDDPFAPDGQGVCCFCDLNRGNCKADGDDDDEEA